MDLFAIPVTELTVPIIRLLNKGVAPQVEEDTTYFIFDATWNSDVPNKIVTEGDLKFQYETDNFPIPVYPTALPE